MVGPTYLQEIWIILTFLILKHNMRGKGEEPQQESRKLKGGICCELLYLHIFL